MPPAALSYLSPRRLVCLDGELRRCLRRARRGGGGRVPRSFCVPRRQLRRPADDGRVLRRRAQPGPRADGDAGAAETRACARWPRAPSTRRLIAPLSLARSGVFAGKVPACLRASRQPLPRGHARPVPPLAAARRVARHRRAHLPGRCVHRLSYATPSAGMRALAPAPRPPARLALFHATPPPTKRALAGLAFADFVKVLGTIVEPKIPRASAVAPAASAGLAAFEQLCRRQLTGSLKKRDLAAFLRSPDPLAADEAERFMRFVSAALLRGNGERGRARRHLNPAASAVLLPPHRRSAWATPRRLTKSNIARSSRR